MSIRDEEGYAVVQIPMPVHQHWCGFAVIFALRMRWNLLGNPFWSNEAHEWIHALENESLRPKVIAAMRESAKMLTMR